MSAVVDVQRPSADKRSLSPGRRRSYRETGDVVAGLRRQIRSVGERVAGEDPDDMRHLLALQDELDRAFAVAVSGLRSSGYSDAAIGAVFGITKQAVQQALAEDRPAGWLLILTRLGRRSH